PLPRARPATGPAVSPALPRTAAASQPAVSAPGAGPARQVPVPVACRRFHPGSSRIADLRSPPWDGDDEPAGGVVKDPVADSEDQDEDEPADDGIALSVSIVAGPAVVGVALNIVAVVPSVLRARPEDASLAPAPGIGSVVRRAAGAALV